MDKKVFEGLLLFLSGWLGYKWPFKTDGRQYKRPLGLSKVRLRPLSRGNCLIEVQITVIKGRQIGTLVADKH